jgi:hypothetical protein
LCRSACEATSNTDVELFQRHFSKTVFFSNGMGSTETGTSTLYFMGINTPRSFFGTGARRLSVGRHGNSRCR